MVLKRLLGAIPLLVGITFLSFLIMRLAPGDYTSMMMDPRMTQADMAALRENLGLNQPIWMQYIKWLKAVLQGNLGYSYVTGKPVLGLILERLGPTLLMSVVSLVLILVITFPLGLLTGAKRYSAFDGWVTVLSFIGQSLPTFWLGMILILAFSVKLDWFPTSGYLDPMAEVMGGFASIKNIALHMVLPMLTIVIGSIAGFTRYFRFGIIRILNEDYIKSAKARGLSDKRILFKHAFKNAALPIVTLLGLELPGLISGSFVIEYIFAWPGMGQLGIQSAFSRDYPVLMGLLLMTSVLILAGNLLADLGYRWIDPRIKHS